MTSTIRGLVSKKKKRFQEDGFDLDLTYVTPRIIAMGFPSQGFEAAYRNPMSEVQRFFTTRHKGHYRIYNLCSERAYDLEGQFESVKRFPFDDHNPCALPVLARFCADVDKFMAQHPENVVAIHCKAGKGRTGLMVATYLLHTKHPGCETAEKALHTYALARTHNGKGVTIPSQQRYVHYYEQELLAGAALNPQSLQITHVRLITVPRGFSSQLKSGGRCDPYFRAQLMFPDKSDDNGVTWRPRTIYDYKQQVKGIGVATFTPRHRFVDLDCSAHNLRVRGDVKLVFYAGEEMSKDAKMFHLWFNTAHVHGGVLTFPKLAVDKAAKDHGCKHFDTNFQVQVFVQPLGAEDSAKANATSAGAGVGDGGTDGAGAGAARGNEAAGAAMRDDAVDETQFVPLVPRRSVVALTGGNDSGNAADGAGGDDGDGAALCGSSSQRPTDSDRPEVVPPQAPGRDNGVGVGASGGVGGGGDMPALTRDASGSVVTRHLRVSTRDMREHAARDTAIEAAEAHGDTDESEEDDEATFEDEQEF